MIFGKKPRMMEKFKKHYDRHKNNNFIGGGQKEFAPNVILNVSIVLLNHLLVILENLH